MKTGEGDTTFRSPLVYARSISVLISETEDHHTSGIHAMLSPSFFAAVRVDARALPPAPPREVRYTNDARRQRGT